MNPSARDDHIAHLPPPTRAPWYAAERAERVRQELCSELESAVEFADFCTFLTAGKTEAVAARLVCAAQTLYDQTVEDLARTGGSR